MEEIIVFDFDKTLTNYDTTFKFYLFCSRNNPRKYIFCYLFFFIKIASKLKIISVKKEKELGLKFFCSSDEQKFLEQCYQFSKTIKLNSLYDNEFKAIDQRHYKIIIASASFQYYLEWLFPNITVIGALVEINKKGKIVGIKQHPYSVEKANLLQSNNIIKINKFYTDSFTDLPTSKISDITFLVENGKIVKSF